ncbi:MAG: hypothetical protein DMG76_23100 [Acidobacteria bacterium]|nr:MAG: hypothetical protein DMG76_23100 [Acidobacteriota bacterium]
MPLPHFVHPSQPVDAAVSLGNRGFDTERKRLLAGAEWYAADDSDVVVRQNDFFNIIEQKLSRRCKVVALLRPIALPRTQHGPLM